MHAIELTEMAVRRALAAPAVPFHAPNVAAATATAPRAHIMVLDDASRSIAILGRDLAAAGFRVTSVASAEAAIRVLACDDVVAVIANLDSTPTHESSILKTLRSYAPTVMRIALTAERDFAKVSRAAMATTVDSVVTAETPFSDVAFLIEDFVARNAARDERVSPEDARMTARGLVRALTLRNYESEDHCLRVSRWARHLASVMWLSPGRVLDVELGAYLHDIGQIGVRDAVLLKPTNLTAEEWVELRKHPNIGAKLLADFPMLRRAIPVVQCHHERWDGGGYPRGLRGNAIPIDARIFQVVDTYDALVAKRPYREARSDGEAREEIVAHAGTQFDWNVVMAFLSISHDELQHVAQAAPA